MIMRAYRLGSLIVLLTLTPWLLGAAQEEVRSMTLDDCIEQALEYNLDLQIERYGPLVAGYNVSLARAGYEPNLSLSGQRSNTKFSGGFDADNRPIPGSESQNDSVSAGLNGLLPWGMTYSLDGSANDRTGSSDNPLIGDFNDSRGAARLSVTQPLLKNLWIDSTRMNIAVAKTRLEQSEQTFRLQVMNIVNQVENAYYDLVFANENMKVQRFALELAQRLLDDNRKRVAVGALAPLDEKQAEAQVAARQADLLSAQRTLDTRLNVLKSLLTDDYAHWHKVMIQPAEKMTAPIAFFDLQDSWMKGMELRPDLQQQRLELERQGIELRFSKNQIFPQLDVFGTYGHNASALEFSGLFASISDGRDPFWSYGARLTFPLSNKAARMRHKANKAAMEQTVLRLKQTEQNIMVEIDNAIKLAETSYRRVDATRQARAYAEAALEAEQKKLENGKSTSFVVLQLQRDLTSAQSEEIRALTEYNKALASLARNEGTTLERHAINFEVKE